ncbi:FecR family protein [Pleomorphovibrio marinus]|uniref:FecR family protein n=1 Tax=Pleomorphovibrio marinus TaxID=2164132 RepID=UPI000E09F696|nr:FecR family protein [Pleomorphovibrio marinus]
MKVPLHIQKLIAKALRGKISPTEKAELDCWYLQEGGTHHTDLNILEKINTKKDLKKTLRKINLVNEPKMLHWLNVVAASIALCIIAGLWWVTPGVEREKLVQLEDNHETIQNTQGIRRKITLADGSKVWLRGESRLQIPRKFVDNRRLRLEGEAFFEVVEDSLHPFQVITELAVTEVLGTSFLINTKNQHQQTITVKTGKVAVTPVIHKIDTNATQTLTALQQVKWNTDGGFGDIQTVDPNLSFSWVEGILFFKETPMSEVLSELEEWYGLEEVIRENLGNNCKVTATYTRMSLKEVMESLQYATGINYKINGKKLKVSEGNC